MSELWVETKNMKVVIKEMKMDYTVPENFIEFELGWYKKYDFDYEAGQLRQILDVSKKKMISNIILKIIENGLFLHRCLKIIILDIMKLLLFRNKL